MRCHQRSRVVHVCKLQLTDSMLLTGNYALCKKRNSRKDASAIDLVIEADNLHASTCMQGRRFST